ncbi:MAG: hypothetical protein A3D26_00585 [Candidatus Blackburnbacteria bacterium RIFCSPHIGHO2_02_FULL_44_20]|uniref:Spore protein YkvP/CgeB glycosyl transferase-like domain-containing protein n=1 Tax=Candidatus Blackburnbacteria bacterium RIFCSPHIGHO2_02_FULL_44_20 TaxID=1797516 RepID=A0A1G1V9E5_9BACT|nr:MAG: hypothetical protein A3E16_02835 [Candidatus Blackburnbacteria bacterium RIFCSPHIGHO2_12_FULL_44_25]OGY12006.1 MAG: hypothetical protein A3D26_00585 [Candidatus Blackburnbacteria bacterium RIFCSPHIGHO2_02_FULL_44_20]
MKKPLKILYQIPSLETVYAARFIYKGYKDAFTDLGYKFRPLTSNDDSKKVLEDYKPDIFISSLTHYNHKFLDLEAVWKQRKRGLVFFTQIYTWKKVNNQYGGGDLESDNKLVSLIKQGKAGDIFFSWIQQGDPLINGFTKTTGYSHQTILLAANKKTYFDNYDKSFAANIAFVGNNLPDKQEIFRQYLFPLKKKYDVRIYGNDWNFSSKIKGYVQKAGQYFNIEPLKHVRKTVLRENDERKVYSSSTISLNIHEEHQRRLGCDFNERTFKIIASGGFEICDNVGVLRKYFTEKELVIGENTKDWFDKIDYYIKNPEKRLPIIKAGKKKVLAKHTYHNRARQFVNLYQKFNRGKMG